MRTLIGIPTSACKCVIRTCQASWLDVWYSYTQLLLHLCRRRSTNARSDVQMHVETCFYHQWVLSPNDIGYCYHTEYRLWLVRRPIPVQSRCKYTIVLLLIYGVLLEKSQCWKKLPLLSLCKSMYALADFFFFLQICGTSYRFVELVAHLQI